MTPTPTTDSAVSPVSDERLREILAMPDEEAKLVAYFRGEGLNDFGLDGDYEGWTPVETAINAMKAFAALRKSMAEHVIDAALASPPSPAEVTEWPPAPDGWTVRKPTYVRRDGKVSVEYCHGTEQPWQVRLAHGNGASHALSEHDTPAAALTAALQLNKKG